MGCHILLLSIALLSFPKGDRDHILALQKRIFSSQKWLHKILPAQKAFLVSAHELSFFLSFRNELGAWLDCTTFIIFFFLWPVATWSKRKLNQTRENAAP